MAWFGGLRTPDELSLTLRTPNEVALYSTAAISEHPTIHAHFILEHLTLNLKEVRKHLHT